MIIRVLVAISLCSIVLCKIAENDTLLPVMRIKEVQTGYLAWPDKQLGKEEEEGPVTTACTPKNEDEAERRVEGMLNTMEGESFENSKPENKTEMIEEEFVKVSFKPSC
ncbi:hypothetical protein PENTCL1PPCAC_23036, partial [Pristionchus entomophagus]